jgi:hypothetical protein
LAFCHSRQPNTGCTPGELASFTVEALAFQKNGGEAPQ